MKKVTARAKFYLYQFHNIEYQVFLRIHTRRIHAIGIITHLKGGENLRNKFEYIRNQTE